FPLRGQLALGERAALRRDPSSALLEVALEGVHRLDRVPEPRVHLREVEEHGVARRDAIRLLELRQGSVEAPLVEERDSAIEAGACGGPRLGILRFGRRSQTCCPQGERQPRRAANHRRKLPDTSSSCAPIRTGCRARGRGGAKARELAARTEPSPAGPAAPPQRARHGRAARPAPPPPNRAPSARARPARAPALARPARARARAPAPTRRARARPASLRPPRLRSPRRRSRDRRRARARRRRSPTASRRGAGRARRLRLPRARPPTTAPHPSARSPGCGSRAGASTRARVPARAFE